MINKVLFTGCLIILLSINVSRAYALDNVGQFPITTPARTASPETILKTEPKKSKPIIQDIGDNAYSTLLDSPIAFLVKDSSNDYYHAHGLSSSSTNVLLLFGIALLIIGLALVKFSTIVGF